MACSTLSIAWRQKLTANDMNGYYDNEEVGPVGVILFLLFVAWATWNLYKILWF